jgi:hypothetical protein
MPLPSSGPISFSDIQSQFGGANPISLSEYYRGGGFVTNTGVNDTIPTSGAISVGNFYNTYGRVPISIAISANTSNYDAYASRTGGYVPGVSDLTYTINSDVVIGATSTSAIAFTINSSFLATDTVTVVNNGRVTGAGGNGGAGANFAPGNTTNGGAGGGGGTALSVARAATITNNGTVAGGGGGGGGGGGSYFGRNAKSDDNIAGGGGGGGAGSIAGSGASGGFAAGQENNYNGRAGASGSLTAGGGGGATSGGGYGAPTGYGGAGGSPGVAGTAGVTGQRGTSGGAGGAAGFYATGNSNITWAATGTRLGQVS